MEQPKTDLFGHKTQGINYELFRPKYPAEYLDKCVDGLTQRRNFMDVATGTGQVLFPIAERFSGTVIGADISDNMLKVAYEKAEEVKARTGLDIRILKQDCLVPAPDNMKFDLITVGEAIHWFDVNKFLELASKSLYENGQFVCLGYFLQRIDPVGAVGNDCKLYEEFLDKTMPMFAVDMNELFQAYTAPRYTFDKHFKSIERKNSVVYTEIGKQQLISYLKTYSVYKPYMDKYGQDPCDDILKGLQGIDRVVMKVIYFGIYCRNPSTQE